MSSLSQKVRPIGRRLVAGVLVAILAIAVLIQFIPYGRAHDNPPALAEPSWNSSQTRALAARACFDCHSNQTSCPWYSNVAPMSWLVQHDVDEGRQKLNYSEWGTHREQADEAAEAVREGKMPPRLYLLMHPEATLSDAEKQQLVEGLIATLGGEREQGSEHGASSEEDD